MATLRKLLVLAILFLFAKDSLGQQPQVLGTRRSRIIIPNQLQVDSLFVLPGRVDTNFVPYKAGAVVYRLADAKIYYHNGTKWQPIFFGATVSETDPTVSAAIKNASASDTTRWGKLYVDSIKRSSDSVYYYIGGSRFFGFKDSTSNVSGKIDSVKRKVGSDSVFYYRGATQVFAFRDSLGTGEITTGTNVGSGGQIFQAKVGVDFRFRTLLAANSNLTVTQNTNDLTLQVKNFVDSVRKKSGTDSVFFYNGGVGTFGFIDLSSATGEANTASNVGAGIGVFKAKSGVDLQFKSLTSDTTVAITGNTNDAEIKVDQTRIASVKRLQDTASSVRAYAGQVYSATTNGQVFSYNGSGYIWDSADYTKLKNTPQVNPGTYIAPGDVFNPGFLVIASAIVRPTSTYVHGNPITWEILNNSTSHNYSFIDSVYGNGGTGQLTLRYPNVKNVLNLTVTPDESLSGMLTVQGPTVGLSTANINVYRPIGMGVRLTGAGTTTWTKTAGMGTTGAWDVTTYNTADGSTSVNMTGSTYTAWEYDGMSINYIGTNGYQIKRLYSGLGAYNIKFVLMDAFGNPVTSAPTSSDVVILGNSTVGVQSINMATYNQNQNSFLTNVYNFWVVGLFEAYMVAAPVSSTSIQVRWQSYPSATQYKIYRATSLYGTRTLIYTGTDFRYDDSGLSASTKYYYFMYATVSGVDTFVTSFNTNTYQ